MGVGFVVPFFGKMSGLDSVSHERLLGIRRGSNRLTIAWKIFRLSGVVVSQEYQV